MHSKVHAIVIESYAALAELGVTHEFVYGETGYSSGGKFSPHRTHQNGRSVDFMVPVVDAEGNPAALPTRLTNKWGYGLEFDHRGQLDDLQIDFEAVALHLAELAEAARAHNAPIRKVIFDPKLRHRLKKTRSWKRIRRLPFTKKRVWVRHDDHYHVEFGVRCK